MTYRLPKSFRKFARCAGHSTNITAARALEHFEQIYAAEKARISQCGPSAGYDAPVVAGSLLRCEGWRIRAPWSLWI